MCIQTADNRMKSKLEAANLCEVGKAIGKPLDPARRVFRASAGEHGLGWLDGHDVISLCSKPCRVSARTCANIEDRAARRWKYGDQVGVDILK
jgi:hypothetical protein